MDYKHKYFKFEIFFGHSKLMAFDNYMTVYNKTFKVDYLFCTWKKAESAEPNTQFLMVNQTTSASCNIWCGGSKHSEPTDKELCMEVSNPGDYSVVLNKRAARLFVFDKFSYLHALIRYLHVY